MSKTFVRLDTFCHDASSEPASHFEKRYLAYLLVGANDLRDVVHGRDDEDVAFREGMPEDVLQLHKNAWDNVIALLSRYGFSKWDFRTGSWMCNGTFYDQEIESEKAKRDRMLFTILMEYEHHRNTETEPSITGQLAYEKLQGGPELLLNHDQTQFLVAWYQRRLDVRRQRETASD